MFFSALRIVHGQFNEATIGLNQAKGNTPELL